MAGVLNQIFGHGLAPQQPDPMSALLQRVASKSPGAAPAEPAAAPDVYANGWKQYGMYEPGNIDIFNRPQVKNADGSISTVRSMSFQDEDGGEVLIPTVSDDGRVLSDDEAVQNYYRTGKHLGRFMDPTGATSFAESLHKQQEQYYLGGQR